MAMAKSSRSSAKRTTPKTPKNPIPKPKAAVFKIDRAKKTTAKSATMPALLDEAPTSSQLNERLYSEHGVAIAALVSRLGGEQDFNSFVEERTEIALSTLEHNGYDLSSLAGEHRDLLLFYIVHRMLMVTERRLRRTAS